MCVGLEWDIYEVGFDMLKAVSEAANRSQNNYG